MPESFFHLNANSEVDMPQGITPVELSGRVRPLPI